jgi:hypothetical protein
MDPDQFFGQLFDDESDKVQAIREQRQLAFEERVIKRAFAESGIKINSWGRLVNECRAATAQPKLNFTWFNSQFRFPVPLCGKRISRLHELTLADLMRPADKNRLYKAVMKNVAKLDIDLSAGFAFVFPVTRKMFCAHTTQREPVPGPRWTIVGEHSILTIEPTTTFFQSIGPGWFMD